MPDKSKHIGKVETQLDCKATASLNDQVIDDMLKEDKPLAEILEEEEEPEDGAQE